MDGLIEGMKASHILGTVVYSLIGLVLFVLCFVVIDRFLPYSVHKEIEEDQNTALGIIIGSMMIGLSIIIAAAIV